MNRNHSIEQMVQKLLTGDRRTAARLIGMVECDRQASHDVMKRIYPHTGKAMVVGVTGPGGAGKSTLLGHIIRRFRQAGKTVGAVLVDPSSPFSGGAFLGDRVRLDKLALDDGVYIRSMATRGCLGGLARAASDAVRIIEAMGMDIIIVETVGVGQDEIEVIKIVQTCLLVLTPNMGDDMQAMKAGVMEIADIIVLNKSDQEEAENCRKNLKTLLALISTEENGWQPPLISTIAQAEKKQDLSGIDELMTGIAAHEAYLKESQDLQRTKMRRVEQEINLIFQERMQAYFLNALHETGKKDDYLQSIMDGQSDPYEAVEEILDCIMDPKQQRNQEERNS